MRSLFSDSAAEFRERRRVDGDRAPSANVISRSLHVQEPRGRPADVTVPAAPPIVPAGAARGTVVFNCPRCFKRYEVDAAMSGKKSRCKDCKEVFTIPAPVLPPAPPPPREPAPVAKSSSLGLRNFTVIPEEVISHRVGEGFVEFKPVQEIRRAPDPVAGRNTGRVHASARDLSQAQRPIFTP